MPRIAMAAPATDEDASSTRVDDLIQRGRSQGHLSLSDLRTAFEQAGLTPAEARSILRELSEAGVRLADEETELNAPRSKAKAAGGAKASTARAATETAAKKTRAKKADQAPAPAGSADGAPAKAQGGADSDLPDEEVGALEAGVGGVGAGGDRRGR